MPIPKPKPGEEQDDYISRCASAIADEFEDNAQRIAVCGSTWREHHGKQAKNLVPPPMVDSETQETYLDRCVEIISEDYPTREERLSVCQAAWDDAKKMSKLTNQKMIEAVADRNVARGIWTADKFVEPAISCLDSNWRTKHLGGDGSLIVKDAGSRLVYDNPDLVIEKEVRYSSFESLLPKDSKVKFPKGTLLGFRNVVTDDREDRDGDILITSGAKLDPMMPLLWQHVHQLICGKMVAVYEHTEHMLRVVSALLDLNDLTEDFAKLVEAEALRISHGFSVQKYEDRKSPDGKLPGPDEHYGFKVLEFTIMEESGVSVPSNVGAVIEQYSRGRLRSEVAKSWAKSFYDARPGQISGAEFRSLMIPVQKTFIDTLAGAISGFAEAGINATLNIGPMGDKAACARQEPKPLPSAAAGQAASMPEDAKNEPAEELPPAEVQPAAESAKELVPQPKDETPQPVEISVDKAIEVLLASGSADDLRRAEYAITAILAAEKADQDAEMYRELVGSIS